MPSRPAWTATRAPWANANRRNAGSLPCSLPTWSWRRMVTACPPSRRPRAIGAASCGYTWRRWPIGPGTTTRSSTSNSRGASIASCSTWPPTVRSATCCSARCSPGCSRTAISATTASSGSGLTPEQKASSDWGGKLRLYLAALADWTGDDDPVEYFQFKSRFYSELFNLAPNGPERDLLLSTLLAWLQQNGYQRDHRVEWFYPVNALIIHAFADPLGMKATMRELRRSSDPVIALFAQLEQLLQRPIQGTMGLL